MEFSEVSLTQKRFRRLRNTALKRTFISVKLAKFQQQQKNGSERLKAEKSKGWAI